MKIFKFLLLAALGLFISFGLIAATPPPSQPAQYSNGTANDTESYITDNSVSNLMYQTLKGLIYDTYQDALKTFEEFFNKVIATVPAYFGYSVTNQTNSSPNGSTQGLVTFHDNGNPQKPIIYISASSPGGAGPWTINESIPGPATLQNLPPEPVPIDGGAALLMGAALVYGVRKINRKEILIN